MFNTFLSICTRTKLGGGLEGRNETEVEMIKKNLLII